MPTTSKREGRVTRARAWRQQYEMLAPDGWFVGGNLVSFDSCVANLIATEVAAELERAADWVARCPIPDPDVETVARNLRARAAAIREGRDDD